MPFRCPVLTSVVSAAILAFGQPNTYNSRCVEPNLTTLPPAQRALFAELGNTPEAFTLYGGTALALHLGHRVSVDFHFLSNEGFDPMALSRSLPYLKGAEILQVEATR